MNRERILAVVRIVALFVTAINALLTAKGINPIPFDETEIGEMACDVAFWIAALWAWWRNNNITGAAISAQNYLNWFKMNHEEVDVDGEDVE